MGKLRIKEDFYQKAKNGLYDQILERIFKSGKFIHKYRIR
jgi:hypothetical protein